MSSRGENQGTNNSQAWQADRTNGQSRDRQQPASIGIHSVSQTTRQDHRHEVSSASKSHLDRGQSQNPWVLNAQQIHGGGQYDVSQRRTAQPSRNQRSSSPVARQQYSAGTEGTARQLEPSLIISSSSGSRASPRTGDRRPSGSSDKRFASDSYSMQRYLGEKQRGEGGDEPWKMVDSLRYIPSSPAGQHTRVPGNRAT